MLYIGCDPAGFALKQHLLQLLDQQGTAYQDLGVYSDERADYVPTAVAVCQKIQQDENGRGVLICGSGIGMSIAANKHAGIRAALCHDVYSAHMCRNHNDANVLCMGARVIGTGLAWDILQAWLTAEFEGGRHAARVDQLNALDAR